MNALVTGGGGFLGGAVVRQLLDRGESVRSLSRQRYQALDAVGVEQIPGDISDADAVEKAVAGCDIVFHVAAKAGLWGPANEYYRANVVGTENVIAACHKQGVGRLVFTSSPSVVTTRHDINGDDESLPYPRRYLAHYPRTKAAAERLVLAANGPHLATVSLRPHIIWGPGDNHLTPRLIERARAGKLRQIGDGKNKVDVTYVDNVADAHLLAADRLAPNSAIAGKAYFVSQGEPLLVWPFINRILRLVGLPPVTRRVPLAAAYAAGAVLEAGYKLLGRTDEPRMTRFLAVQLGTSHWFDISAARRDLGYQPAVSTEEGLRRLGRQFSGAVANSLTDPHPPSP
jgi:2-alkyl-3-oxoalkanoate reductase